MLKFLRATVGAMAVALVAGGASAASYQLDDHPYGSKSGSYDYGLRLDGPNLFFTFSEDNGSNVRMDASGGTAHIYGTIYQSTGVGTTTGVAWTYDYKMSYTGADDDFMSWDGAGYVTDGSSYYALLGMAKKDDPYHTFQFGTDDPKNKLVNTFVGWGWVSTASCDPNGTNCGDYTYSGAQDGLWTATPVPLPAAAWLMIAGFGALGVARSRRSKA
ncbi:MAG: VPLPA-CTERM sorting domain-containing protein [Pseudomonadota bacterium]